ncbi:MAG: prepilin peptidase, partial [Bifidobacteriaceae bacterium]|nr:prepilin peptidase [Bifidobacteriaceae bacterium]
MSPEWLDVWIGGLAAALLGLVVGSFLTVVAVRVPQRIQLQSRSRCPRCQALVRPRDNIPVVSWLVLHGKCRSCSEPISKLYPVIELATATLFVLVVLGVRPVAAIPAYLYVAGISVVLTVIDAQTRRLPNGIVLPSYLVLPVLLALASWATGDWGALLRAGAGGLGAYLLYGLLHLVPGGMGF